MVGRFQILWILSAICYVVFQVVGGYAGLAALTNNWMAAGLLLLLLSFAQLWLLPWLTLIGLIEFWQQSVLLSIFIQFPAIIMSLGWVILKGFSSKSIYKMRSRVNLSEKWAFHSREEYQSEHPHHPSAKPKPRSKVIDID